MLHPTCSRILVVITALLLPPDSVLITSNALLLAGLKSWGCLTEMFLEEVSLQCLWPSWFPWE